MQMQIKCNVSVHLTACLLQLNENVIYYSCIYFKFLHCFLAT